MQKVLVKKCFKDYTLGMKANITRAVSYSFQGKTLWLEIGTEVNIGVNYTYTLPDGSFLFIPSVYVSSK